MTAGLLVALLLGQAQAAPVPEARVAAPPPPPPYLIGVAMGGGRRLDPAASDVPPTYGLQFSTLLGRRYLLLADRLELGGAFHFAFQRYARDVTIPAAPATSGGVHIEDVRTLTYYDLSLQQTCLAGARPLPPVRGGGRRPDHGALRDAGARAGAGRGPGQPAHRSGRRWGWT